jgi:hypothetical protein
MPDQQHIETGQQIEEDTMPKDPIQTARAPWSFVAAFAAVALISLGAQDVSWAKPADEIAVSPAAASALPRDGLGQISHAPPSMEDTYAAREATSKNLETFKGGDVVIIGSTALIIVLLVILILVV